MKKMRRIITIVLTLALIIGTMMTVSTPASAKVKGTKKYTMYVGSKAEWKLWGTGGKKVTFKSSNKKIATISKKGIITAKKKGKCTLTAKVGKKMLKCKLTVKKRITTAPTINTPVVTNPPIVTNPPVVTPTPVPDTIINNQLAGNILVTKTVLPSNKLLLTVTNNNTSQVYMTSLNMAFYDANGLPVKTGEDTQYYMDPAETRYVVINKYDKTIDYSKTVVSVICKKSGYSSKQKVTVNYTAQPNANGDIILTCVNPNTVKANLNGVAFFKDASGAVLDAQKVSDYLEPGATKFVTIKAPTDTNYDKIPYVSYEINYYADAYVN